MADPLLRIEALHSGYGDAAVLHGIDLAIAEGSAVALLGRNGAGKSTLLKTILNAGPRVTGGRITLDGRDVGPLGPDARARAGLMLVPEDRRIFPHITVAENIALGAHAARPGVKPMTMDEIWALFPALVPFAARAGYALSGGQQQMVAVARGVIARPRLLLLDEPVEGLAPVIVDQMAAEIRRLHRDHGLTVLVTEQNLAFARAVTDQVHLIDSGQLVYSGSWDAFDADPSLKTRYLAV
ncbi:ABC transporter ATP-binding protein [Tistrella mobilis]|uniref:ABC transporter ATP-binding protein n=1 Tax=Tistrella mobilis TaxID=171437 RepID=UPI0035583F97